MTRAAAYRFPANLPQLSDVPNGFHYFTDFLNRRPCILDVLSNRLHQRIAGAFAPHHLFSADSVAEEKVLVDFPISTSYELSALLT